VRKASRSVSSHSHPTVLLKTLQLILHYTVDELQTWLTTSLAATEARLQRVLSFRAAVCNHLIENGVEFEVDSDFTFPEGPRYLAGSFGTPAHPVLVPSWSEQRERPVGCIGGTGVREHEILWHNVKQEKPAVCLDCGQYVLPSTARIANQAADLGFFFFLLPRTFKLVGYDEFLEWAATEWEKGHKIERWWHEP